MNIVVADSGSTKADWIIFNSGRTQLVTTPGINPTTGSGLSQKLPEELAKGIATADHIYFYAAGGGGFMAFEKMATFFEDYLQNGAHKITIDSDMLGAARAASGAKPAIIGILGTGSNSCLYDGEKIVDQIPSLGYLLSDEGSGNHIGKLLIKSYFYREMEVADHAAFEDQFEIQREEVLKQLYLSGKPSSYLAAFSPFLKLCSKTLRNKILDKVFTEFIETRIIKYHDFSKFDLYFAGSIADVFHSELAEVCDRFDLKIAGIVRKPIESLLQYHLSRE